MIAAGVRSLALAMALVSAAAPLSAEPARPAPLQRVGVTEHVGEVLPLDLPFRTAQGARVRLGDVIGNGKPVLLVLAYNRCEMLCSLVLRASAEHVRRSRWTLGERYRVVTVGIHPRESVHESARTQATVLEQAGHPGAAADWPFLVGERRSVDELAGALGFEYAWDERTEQYAHPAVVFVIDEKGRIARYFYGLRLDTGEVEAALGGAPASAAPGTLAAAVLSCFRFEGLGARYGGIVQNAFRVGALLVLGTVVGLIGFLTVRNARRST